MILMRSPLADSEVAGERCPVLGLPGVEQGLVMSGKLERVAGFLGSVRSLWFGFAGTVPGDDLDNRRSPQPLELQGSAFNEPWFELSTPWGASWTVMRTKASGGNTSGAVPVVVDGFVCRFRTRGWDFGIVAAAKIESPVRTPETRTQSVSHVAVTLLACPR